MHTTEGNCNTRYRDMRGNWKGRRKPHFVPLAWNAGWICTMRKPGSLQNVHGVGRTPAEAQRHAEHIT